jgi:hypothetical protein
MIQVKLDDGLLKLVKQGIDEHPAYRVLNLRNDASRVKRVFEDFAMNNYFVVHKNELEEMIRDVIRKRE